MPWFVASLRRLDLSLSKVDKKGSNDFDLDVVVDIVNRNVEQSIAC